MGYSINDLNNAVKRVHQSMEDHSRQQGEELANQVLDSTSRGRGLWLFILLPAWLMIALMLGTAIAYWLDSMHLSSVVSGIGAIAVGIVGAQIWFKANFTRRHPLLSTIFWWFAICFVCVMILGRL